MKKDGFIFIDDISSLPYFRNKPRNSFYCEINNNETFEKILEIYDSNIENLDLSFSFISSGLAIIKKKTKKKLNPRSRFNKRTFSIKNIIRVIRNLLVKR